MVKFIVVPNEKDLEEKENKIIKGGLEKFHVLADFDRTLTKEFVNGKRIPSIISVLRDGHYLSEEYSKKANELYKKYHLVEIDHSIPLNEKKKFMEEWWRKHFDLLIKSGINKKNLRRAIEEGHVEFRDGVIEFINLLNQNKIPLVIISSSGLGNLIPMFLKKHGVLYDNVFIITNLYEWDSEGNAIGVKPPLIHVFNKDETIIKDFPDIYGKIKDRKNVLLLGDSLGDLGMIHGFDYDCLINAGFLNSDVDENLDMYKNNFDVIITNDGNFDYINRLVERIK